MTPSHAAHPRTWVTFRSKCAEWYGRIVSERGELYHRFWRGLLDRVKERTALHSSVSPSSEYRLHTPTGIDDTFFVYVIRKHDTEVQLYRRGDEAETDAERRRIFDALHEQRDEIERAFGTALRWQREAGKLNWWIATSKIELGGWSDEDRWPEIQDATITEMIRLEGALRPFLEERRDKA